VRKLKSLVILVCLVGPLGGLALPASPQTMQSVAAAAGQSVCIVLAERGNGTTSGTGFVVADGYVLTSHHLAQGADRLRVLCPDHPPIEVKLANADADNDIALLHSSLLSIRPLPLGGSGNVQVGQEIVVIGFPRADLVGAETATVTQGIVNSVRGGALQIQAPVGPGSSGSPVLTLQGQVIGVVRAVLGNQVGTNLATSFATAIDAAKPFLTSALGGLYGSVNVANPPPGQRAPQTTQSSSKFVITPGQDIGDLKLGMRREEFERLLGPAKQVSRDDGVHLTLGWQSSTNYRGLFVVLSSTGEAIMIGVVFDPRYVLQGVHLGSTEFDVRVALGEPSRVELTSHKIQSPAPASLKVLYYDSLGLRLVIQNNPKYANYLLVSSIAVFRSGCLFNGSPVVLQSGTCQ